MKLSIIAATAMIAMSPLGNQAPQDASHKPDSNITVSTAANDPQRILCTLFLCRK
jgi:hypothetical protein